jgi:hypothetical protein
LGKVQSFLSHYEAEGTKRGYLGHVKKFLDFIYPDSKDLEQKADSYFTEGRDYLKDVEGFLASTSQEAPMTRRMRLSTVKLFLIDNDVELGERNWKALSRRIKGKRSWRWSDSRGLGQSIKKKSTSSRGTNDDGEFGWRPTTRPARTPP